MTKRILVVEDQEDNRRIMHDLLVSAGFEVIEALSGDEAVAMAAAVAPDLILMDIQLPGIDGLEATRRIRNESADSKIPIIAVTSYAMSDDNQKALEAGCDAYFAKPVSPKTLLAKIQTFLPSG